MKTLEKETESFTVFLEENGVELERQELKMLLWDYITTARVLERALL